MDQFDQIVQNAGVHGGPLGRNWGGCFGVSLLPNFRCNMPAPADSNGIRPASPFFPAIPPKLRDPYGSFTLAMLLKGTAGGDSRERCHCNVFPLEWNPSCLSLRDPGGAEGADDGAVCAVEYGGGVCGRARTVP